MGVCRCIVRKTEAVGIGGAQGVSRAAEGRRKRGGGGPGRFRGAWRRRRNRRRGVGCAERLERWDHLAPRLHGPRASSARGGRTQQGVRAAGRPRGSRSRVGCRSAGRSLCVRFLVLVVLSATAVAMCTSLTRVEDVAGFPKPSKLRSKVNFRFLFPQGWKFS